MDEDAANDQIPLGEVKVDDTEKRLDILEKKLKAMTEWMKRTDALLERIIDAIP